MAVQDPGGILAELGWTRTEGITEGSHGDDRVPAIDADQDPVAREIRKWAILEDGYAVAAEKLCGLPERYKEWELPNIPGWWPTGPREMQDHLRRLAPALREAGVLAEYWEKRGVRAGAAGAPTGFWLFLSTEKWRPTHERLEGLVWQRVAYMEGMEPVLGTFMDEV